LLARGTALTVAKVAAVTSTARNLLERATAGAPVQVAEFTRTIASISLGRIGNLDSDSAALEVYAVESQSLLEALEVLELSIRETLRAVLLAILDNPDVQHLASLEELGDGLGSRIVGEVSEMSGKRRLGGQCLREVVTN